jgi:hypothetical protein
VSALPGVPQKFLNIMEITGNFYFLEDGSERGNDGAVGED